MKKKKIGYRFYIRTGAGKERRLPALFLA